MPEHDEADRGEQTPAPTSPSAQIPRRIRAVGPGWQPVLARLHDQLTALCPGYRLADVKEKLGGLRVYVDALGSGERDAVRSLIKAAEAEAAVTCEFCGAPGRTRRRGDAPHGWLKTVCDSCHRAWSAHQIMLVNGSVWQRRST
ncbi:hypothetical protein ACFPH6_33260 [Streptomyces xiangluensis]|uniref:Uncharacterized protein n=1 Tax=Streptomyces xiangluensis TaxID=2665720 RepID=A0ABV8YX79_9ACTN